MWRLLMLLLPALTVVRAQMPPCALLDSALAFAHRSSYYGDALADSSLKRLRGLCAEARATPELAPAFTALLNTLGDHHGRVMMDGQVVAWLTDQERSHRRDERAPDQAFWRQVVEGRYGLEARMLDRRTGYLPIPAIQGSDLEAQAALIRRGLDSLAALGADRWVVDLRINSGGNMWPMLEGLAPLFPEGPVAGALDRHGQRFATYAFRQGHFERNGFRAVALQPGKDHSSAKVCVLLGRYTASSGEVVAACFRGRPRTHLVGEASAGYTTETGWTQLDRVTLVISESVLCDLNDRPYSDHIAPDEHIDGPHPGFDPLDPAMARALRWLAH
jgi:C-terminal processing protease CtpA/Prc